MSQTPVDQPDLAAILTEWMSASDWAASEQFFTDHRDEMANGEVKTVLKSFSGARLEDAATHTAIWYMAFTDEMSTAFGYVKDQSLLRARVERALREADGAALFHLAWLEVFVYHDPLLGAVHLWVSTKIDDDVHGAPPIESLHPSAGDRERAAGDVALLLRHHPEHAPALTLLLQTVLYPAP